MCSPGTVPAPSTLAHIGVFEGTLPETTEPLANPFGDDPLGIDMNLRAATPLADMQICNVDAVNSFEEVVAPWRVTPGLAEQSLLYRCIDTSEPGLRMPPYGRNEIDDDGAEVVRSWINTLQGCD